ncbi:hypothetical protein ACFSSC_06005 [Corynebacterium mendelii]|uniref:PPM-type phosphatase domain-containing protein n=1 Tax=Corynebacterium mendelii TaxID=2765362 RepID=A0A939IWH9_9CORY|nr:hypothetical protein [Corynebacterium mendelii]MBN9643043.1 hypothetical protein [Corynebacterium mendelii]
MRIDSFTWSRKPVNQDGMATGERIFAVCDGVTPLASDAAGPSAVADYAHTLADALTSCPVGSITMQGMRGHLQQALDRASAATGGSGAQSTMALVTWDDSKLGVAVCGDSPVVIDRAGQITVLSDPLFSTGFWDLPAADRRRICAGCGDITDLYTRLHEDSVSERATRNRPGGRWIAASGVDSRAVAAVARVVVVPLAGIDRVAAMSDGMQVPVEHLCLAGYGDILFACGHGSLGRLHQRADSLELADPHRRTHPRPSHRDDATIIMASMGPPAH